MCKMCAFRNCALLALLAILCTIANVAAKTDPGKTYTKLIPGCNIYRKQWPLLANSKICVKIDCEKHSDDAFQVLITWAIKKPECWLNSDLNCYPKTDSTNSSNNWMPPIKMDCNGLITLTNSPAAAGAPIAKVVENPLAKSSCKALVDIPEDGIYEMEIMMESVVPGKNFVANYFFETPGPHGYISAVDWPLLPVNELFY